MDPSNSSYLSNTAIFTEPWVHEYGEKEYAFTEMVFLLILGPKPLENQGTDFNPMNQVWVNCG